MVERPAQHGIAGLLERLHLLRAEVHGEVGVARHERDALVSDFALDGRFFLEIREDLLDGVGIQAPAGHVLGAGVVAALDQQHLLARLGDLIGGNRARKARTHHDRIEISHVNPLLP